MKRSKLLTIPQAAVRMLPAPTHLRRLFVALVALLTMTAQTAWAEITGDGSVENPYTINTATDWETFAQRVTNGETFKGKYVQLGDNFENSTSPITKTAGCIDMDFKGTFNGRGRTIWVNLSASSTSDGQNVGLFGSISGATIQNVKVEGNITSNNYNLGTFAGRVGGNSTIRRCWSNAAIVSTKGKDTDCGAMVGIIKAGTLYIIDCAFTGSIALNDNGYEGGGFAGWISKYNSNPTQINNCLFAPSSLTAAQDSDNKGYVFVSGSTHATLTNCYYNSVAKSSNLNKEGNDASGMTNEALLAALGSGWEIIGNNVVPIISANNLYTATITGVNSRYFYNGSAHSITPVVTDAQGNTLTLGTDYTATLGSANVASFPFTVTNEGDYTLTVTGIGSYRGTQTISFCVSDCPDGLFIDNEIPKGTVGHYYVNMPKTGTTTVTLPDGFTSSFKVYDDGGKDGNHSVGCDGYLILTAPQGFSLKLTGIITTADSKYDILAVYDGNTASDENKRAEIQGNGYGYSKDIGTISSSGRSLTLYFHSLEIVYAGLDLTVELVDSRVSNTITINASTGGTVTSSANTAYMDEEITLTISPSTGYLLSGLAVKNGEDQNLVTNGGEWYSGSNTSTFVMARSAVTVTPTFTNNLTAEGGLSMKMPKAGSLTPTIPSGVSSFKVTYDALITEAGTSTLLVTAPEGYLVQLTGHANFTPYCQGNRAIFKVYDGNTTGGQTLSEIQKVDEEFYNDDIYPTVSTGQSMLITCESQYSPIYDVTNNYRWDLDLIVTFVKIEPHSISFNNSNGTVTSDKQTAQPGETVSLTVTPAEGYVLKDITAADADGAITISKPSAEGHWGDEVYYTATSGYSFKMRAKDVTVTPEFIPVTDFHVIIPSTSSRTFDIPAGTTSFKVRHTTINEHTGQHFSGDSETHYSSGYNGTLLLTAPEGYKLQITGTVTTNDNGDYLNVYDGSTIEATVQRFDGNGYHNAVAVDITSTGNQMLLNFITNGEGAAKGLDLRVTPIYPITYKGVEGATFSTNKNSYTFESAAITLDAPTKDGYTFAGWFDNAEFTGDAITTITAGSTGDKTLWAKWIQDLTYGGVTIKDNGTTKSATLDASQEGTVSITSDVVVNAVELNRDFTANQPATVMLPFSLSDGQTVSGGSFYKFSGVTKDGDEWKALFTEVATLKANTPYLFMPSATGQVTFDLNGGTVTLNTTTIGETGSTASNWEFRGTYAKVQWDGTASDPSDLSKTYGFAKGNATIAAGQFVHFAAGAWLKPMRCYLVYNGSTEGGTFQNARSMTRGAASTEELPQTITVVLMSSSGETTGIGTLDTKTGDITLDGWYTMDGRKLEGKPTKKGLYINNGRKIVIK